MHITSCLLGVFISQLHVLDAARILALFGFCNRLQYEFVEPLLLQLAERGHYVTVISNFPQRVPVENFRDMVIEDNKYAFEAVEYKNYSVNNIGMHHYDVVQAIYNMATENNKNILRHRHMRMLMETESFDLIMTELFFSESLFGFADYFQAPIVGVSYWCTGDIIDKYVGNVSPLSYIPSYTILQPFSSNMNFRLRCLNVVLSVLDWIHYHYRYLPMQKKTYENYFPNATMTFEEAQKMISLVLINDHFTLTTPRPYVPNMIEVAGLHIPLKPIPLSPELNRTLHAAEQGIVYMDFDFIFPIHIMSVFFNEFRKLPQTILWNTQLNQQEIIDRIPENIIFHSNLSRHSVLSHASVKLYICFGNYLQVVESVYYGVPILGLPNIYGIQEEYIDFLKKIDNGISLPAKQFHPKSLEKALSDLLATDKYQRHAFVLSQRFRDQRSAPMDKAIYWIEYVLRYKGALHMRNLGQNLIWWQYYNLDVMLFLAFVIVSCILLAFGMLKLLLRIVRIKQNKQFKYD